MIRKISQEVRLTREEHQKKLEETVTKIKKMKALQPQEEERHSKMIMLHLEMIRKTKGLWVLTEIQYRPERNIKLVLGEFQFQPPV